MKAFSLTAQPIPVAALRAALESPRAGAVATFEGTVRNHHRDRAVLRLAYQAFDRMAEREGARIVEEARSTHAIEQALCVHRIGELAIGDVAVWVGVSAAHRDAAFAACRWIIDEIKQRVPIWKKEFYADGESEWLHPTA